MSAPRIPYRYIITFFFSILYASFLSVLILCWESPDEIETTFHLAALALIWPVIILYTLFGLARKSFRQVGTDVSIDFAFSIAAGIAFATALARLRYLCRVEPLLWTGYIIYWFPVAILSLGATASAWFQSRGIRRFTLSALCSLMVLINLVYPVWLYGPLLIVGIRLAIILALLVLIYRYVTATVYSGASAERITIQLVKFGILMPIAALIFAETVAPAMDWFTDDYSKLIHVCILLCILIAADMLIRTGNRALVVGGILCSFVIMEILLHSLAFFGVPGIRIVGPADYAKLNYRRPGEQFVFVGNMGSKTGEFIVPGRWNDWGFNDRDFPEQRPQCPVVAVLGDSFTEALQVSREKNFYRMAETILTREGLPIYAVGLGVGGSGLADSLDRLDAFGPLIRPDIVVYAFCGNDIIDDYDPWKEDLNECYRPPAWLLPRGGPLYLLNLIRYHLWRFIRFSVPCRGDNPINPEYMSLLPYDVADVKQAYDSYFYDLNMMNDMAGELGADFIVLELSLMVRGYEEIICEKLIAHGFDCDPDIQTRRIQDEAHKNGYEVVRTKDQILRASTSGEKLFYTYNGHYNERGNEIIGRVLADAIRPHLIRENE